jgi:hypothetical protein
MGVDASTLFVDIDMSTICHQCHQMSSMSIKRRHCVNNIDNVGNSNNVRLCMTSISHALSYICQQFIIQHSQLFQIRNVYENLTFKLAINNQYCDLA